jgi:NADH:ubiquinone oxidoreductase subunit E
MKKIKISICTGTACYVMGASELLLLKENLPENLKNKVIIEGVTCLDKCKNPKNGKSPFVIVDDELISDATINKVIEKITEKVKTITEELHA